SIRVRTPGERKCSGGCLTRTTEAKKQKDVLAGEDTRRYSIRKILNVSSENNRPTAGRGSNQKWRPHAPLLMCRILLVEDHYDTQQAFAAILKSWGHCVGTSGTVAGGIDFLKHNPIDIV